MAPIRYRRTSVKTALGITKVEKEIKRDLGITALLKPFRWWGNEKRKVKRELGYYSPGMRFVRHFFPHATSMVTHGAVMLVIAFVGIGWYYLTANNGAKVQVAPANPPVAGASVAGTPVTAPPATGEWTTATIHASGNLH